MKPKYDVKFLKSLGQYFIAPFVGLILAVIAVKAGRIPGGFALIFGGFIWMAMTFVILVVYDKFVVKRCIAENERQEKEYREKIRRLMDEDNSSGDFGEYDDTGFVDDRYEEERTGMDEYERRKSMKKKNDEEEPGVQLRELDYERQPKRLDSED